MLVLLAGVAYMLARSRRLNGEGLIVVVSSRTGLLLVIEVDFMACYALHLRVSHFIAWSIRHFWGWGLVKAFWDTMVIFLTGSLP